MTMRGFLTGPSALGSLPKALAAACVLAVGFAPAASAQDPVRSEQVRFAPGTTATSLSGVVSGRETVLYEIGAEAGQTMDVRLTSASDSVYFNVYEPGRGLGEQALAVSDQIGSNPMVPDLNRFSAILPTSGTYKVAIYLVRAAARRGESAGFMIDISVSALEGTSAPVTNDFADGVRGGPDFLQVRTTDGGILNLRAGPSGSAAVVARLANGSQVRNLGCRRNEARRWCNVATLADPGAEGWAAGDFLVEGSGDAAATATQLPDLIPVPDGDVTVPGTAFQATGKIECVPDADAASTLCEFGVTREGNGNGWITVTLPDGEVLRLRFEDLAPVTFDAAGRRAGHRMTVGMDSDNRIVIIGDTRLVIPLAVMAGG